jgi:hypothetical protein
MGVTLLHPERSAESANADGMAMNTAVFNEASRRMLLGTRALGDRHREQKKRDTPSGAAPTNCGPLTQVLNRMSKAIVVREMRSKVQ